MPDVHERLGRVEHRLDRVENRLEKVEIQLDTLTGRVDVLTGRVDVLTGRVDVLTGRVDVLTGRVDVLTGRVDVLTERVDTLGGEVQKLRLLEEDNAQQIKLIAEVQVHHGNMLQQLVRDVEPLKVLPNLLHHVIHDHELRITALERRADASPS